MPRISKEEYAEISRRLIEADYDLSIGRAAQVEFKLSDTQKLKLYDLSSQAELNFFRNISRNTVHKFPPSVRHKWKLLMITATQWEFQRYLEQLSKEEAAEWLQGWDDAFTLDMSKQSASGDDNALCFDLSHTAFGNVVMGKFPTMKPAALDVQAIRHQMQIWNAVRHANQVSSAVSIVDH